MKIYGTVFKEGKKITIGELTNSRKVGVWELVWQWCGKSKITYINGLQLVWQPSGMEMGTSFQREPMLWVTVLVYGTIGTRMG